MHTTVNKAPVGRNVDETLEFFKDINMQQQIQTKFVLLTGHLAKKQCLKIQKEVKNIFQLYVNLNLIIQ